MLLALQTINHAFARRSVLEWTINTDLIQYLQWLYIKFRADLVVLCRRRSSAVNVWLAQYFLSEVGHSDLTRNTEKTSNDASREQCPLNMWILWTPVIKPINYLFI